MGSKDEMMDLAWRKAIAGLCGKDGPGSSRLVFPCVRGTQAVFAGAGVPKAITNYELLLKGDALLRESDTWYTPSASASYSGSLANYMDYVVLSTGDAASQDLLNQREKAATDAAQKNQKLTADSLAEYNKGKADLYMGMSFKKFLEEIRPDVLQARETTKLRTRELYAAQQAAGIPGMEAYKKAMENFAAIRNKEQKGNITMPTANDQVLDADKYVEALREDGKADTAPEPDEVIYEALYTLSPNYRSTMDKWYKEFTTKTTWSDTIKLDESTSVEEVAKQTGHSTETVRASLGGFFSWLDVSYDKTSNFSKSQATSKTGNISVEVQLKNKLVFDISPGQWNIPGYRKMFPRVKDNCPDHLKELVQPVSMLCASGVRISIKFDGETKSTFDEEINKSSAANGRLRIFGFSVNANPNDTTTKDTTHKASYNPEEGTLIIEPTVDAGSCVLLAMIGKKVTN